MLGREEWERLFGEEVADKRAVTLGAAWVLD
jgi:hypothetical protein